MVQTAVMFPPGSETAVRVATPPWLSISITLGSLQARSELPAGSTRLIATLVLFTLPEPSVALTVMLLEPSERRTVKENDPLSSTKTDRPSATTRAPISVVPLIRRIGIDVSDAGVSRSIHGGVVSGEPYERVTVAVDLDPQGVEATAAIGLSPSCMLTKAPKVPLAATSTSWPASTTRAPGEVWPETH